MSIIPSYQIIKRHGYSQANEKKLMFTYDDILEDEILIALNDPRLPTNLRKAINQYEYTTRDLTQIVIRYYAYALEHPNHIHEPIEAIQMAIYIHGKSCLKNAKISEPMNRELMKWSKRHSEAFLNNGFTEAKYLMRIVTGDLRTY